MRKVIGNGIDAALALGRPWTCLAVSGLMLAMCSAAWASSAGGVGDLGVGLELYLSMDGDILDDSGNGRDGIASGDLQYTDGVAGAAAAFDGIDDSVTFPTVPDAIFSDQDFTLSFWADIPIHPRYSVVSKRPICNSAPFLDTRIEGFRRLEPTIADGQPAAATSPRIVYDEGWNHFVAVRQGVEIRGYLNGILVDTESTPYLYDIENTIDFGISTSPCIGVDGTERLLGTLDELRVHSRVLTDEEVWDLYGMLFADGFESGDTSGWTN